MRKTFVKMLTLFQMRLYSNEFIHSLGNAEFKETMDSFMPENKVVFLDVREDEEVNALSLPNFNIHGVKLRKVRIPILDLIELQIEELKQYKDTHQILCYCRNGNKSLTATRILNLHGFNALNLKGGLRLLGNVTELWKIGKSYFLSHF